MLSFLPIQLRRCFSSTSTTTPTFLPSKLPICNSNCLFGCMCAFSSLTRPGDVLLEHEDEIAGLKRILTRLLTGDKAENVNWDVSECLASWVQSNSHTDMMVCHLAHLIMLHPTLSTPTSPHTSANPMQLRKSCWYDCCRSVWMIAVTVFI